MTSNRHAIARYLRALTVALPMCVSPAIVRADSQVAVQGQTVSTGQNGKQILFRDKTSISAGANTSINFTRAQYDAASGSANVVIEVTRGAFRYVTGDVGGSHTVKTPLSTVGVRGTVIEGYVDVNGYEIFVLVEGAFEVCSKVVCQQVTQPGTYVVVNPNGTISPPAPIPPSLLNALLLTVPSVDLMKEHFSDLITSGADPLVRFRDLNESQNNIPAPPPPPPDEGGGCEYYSYGCDE